MAAKRRAPKFQFKKLSDKQVEEYVHKSLREIRRLLEKAHAVDMNTADSPGARTLSKAQAQALADAWNITTDSILTIQTGEA